MNRKFGLSQTWAAMLFIVATLAGCLGGGDSGTSSSTSSTLSGVAAVGSPIVNGALSIRCAAGNALSATTNGTGAWQATLSGQTLPCALQVSGGTVNGATNPMTYHSILSTLAFPTNVTPLTDLIVANLAGTANPAVWFEGLAASPAALSAITQGDVDAALAKLRTAMSGLTPLASNSPLNMTFTATPGNVGDDMLSAMQAAMTSAGVTYAAMLSNAALAEFPAFVSGFNTALTTAYAETGGGTTGIAAPSGVTATASSATQISVNWGSVADATTYNIYRSTATDFTPAAANKIGEQAAGPFADSGLTASTTYYYMVTAVNATGESSASAEASATTSAADSGTPPAQGSYSNCFGNLALITAGNTYQTDLETLDGGSVVSATTNAYTVNGTKTLNGQSTIELQVDTAVNSGAGAGTTNQLKHYFQQTASHVISYGTENSLSVMGLNVTTTITYTPPMERPINLALNQSYVTNTTMTTSAMGTSTSIPLNTTTTFLGVETLSVPAGTYPACKIQTVSSGGTTYEWYVADGIHSGLFLQSADAGSNVTARATRLLFNGQ